MSSLSSILDSADAEDLISKLSEKQEQDAGAAVAAQPAAAVAFCIECGDQPAILACRECADIFCEVCFASQHKKGNRQKHSTTPLQQAIDIHARAAPAAGAALPSSSSSSSSVAEEMEDAPDQPTAAASRESAESLADRAKWVPLRLSLEDRKMMRLLEATMNVSEYTDKIDSASARLSI